MISRGLLALTTALALVAGCDGFHGFPRRSSTQALGGKIRIAGRGNVERPRFAASVGNFLTYLSLDEGNHRSVFAVNAFTLETMLVSRPSGTGSLANDESLDATVTGTGDAFAFLSRATNLVTDTPVTFERAHVYVRDDAGENRLVSQNADGVEADRDSADVTISSNGRFVVFSTDATNLLPEGANGVFHLYLWDRTLETLELLTKRESDGLGANGDSTQPAISPDGRFVAFRSLASDLGPADDNRMPDVYVFDRSRREFDRVTSSLLVDPGHPVIAANGRHVAFDARPGAQADRQVFVFDRVDRLLDLVSADNGGAGGNGDSETPSVSPDGRFVAFESDATNLSPLDGPFRDVYVHDRQAGRTALVSAGLDNTPSDGRSGSATISPDGALVGFATFATNLALLNEDEEETSSSDLLILLNPHLVED